MTGAGRSDLPWRLAGGTLELRVRLTTKGGRDAIDGLTRSTAGPVLQARVRAPPSDGAANAALEALLAGWLGVARRDVTIAAGHKSRLKSVAVAGDAAAVEARLHTLLAAVLP